MATKYQQLTNNRVYVHAQLPHAGLGNRLFVWAKAFVFATLNDFILMDSNWLSVKIGAILRGERGWRLYHKYFKHNSDLYRLRAYWIHSTYSKIVEPPVQPLSKQMESHYLYIFNQIPHWSNYFGDIREHRDLVRSQLYRMLVEKYHTQVKQHAAPCIAVHVRRGDFRELQNNEDFAKVGAVRTPLNYFYKLIHNIREIYGCELPVTIFSDGHDHDLRDLLNIPFVARSPTVPDIVDLLLMSRSQLIITSAGSTFSYWAGFLSDAPVLLHPAHVHTPIRPEIVNKHFFEGGVDHNPQNWPDLLIENIRKIKVSS